MNLEDGDQSCIQVVVLRFVGEESIDRMKSTRDIQNLGAV